MIYLVEIVNAEPYEGYTISRHAFRDRALAHCFACVEVARLEQEEVDANFGFSYDAYSRVIYPPHLSTFAFTIHDLPLR